MIDRLVSFALGQRFIIIIGMLGVAIWGVVSFRNLPIDAYPDLVPPRVQIVTQWPTSSLGTRGPTIRAMLGWSKSCS